MKKYFGLGIIIVLYILFCSINIGNAYCGYDLDNDAYNKCINFEKWLSKVEDADKKNDYVEVIFDLEQAKKYASTDSIATINDIILTYAERLGNIYYNKGNYSEAIKYYKKALAIYENPITLYNIGFAYYFIDNYDTALVYLNKAKQKSLDLDLDEKIVYGINLVKLAKEFSIAKKNWKTNDTYGFFQYYLPGINIFDAWDKLPNNKRKVVIAVIDDGINLNHPDLKDKLWINKKEIDGDGIDNDKNGYIDDYNGWDFTLNTKPTLPSDSHGTMVAGIIGANTDNVIGIAGIVPEVEIMSLKVFGFDSDGAEADDIIEAVNYAINNGANVINLSIEGSQFIYSNIYDDVFKKAHDKGIVVVVAAGNGDLLSSYSEGVNTSVNKKSPVCNESNQKVVIGVGALAKNGAQAKWSNYGACVDFYMYGEDIFSTAITLDGAPYSRANGTSFSSPIVAGIIGLGYNAYGKIKPDIVYANLKRSLSGNVIDAAKYLDNLSIQQGDLGKAIKWLSTNKFTKATNASDFKYNNGITRAEAAKFFVMYAEKFNKNKIVNSDDKCKFSDLGAAPVDLRSYMINACRYGLLAGSKGKFMPNSKLTNAQAVTVFMRMYGGKKDESGTHFANQYFIEAYKLGLLDGMIMGKQKNYEKGAKRGDMAVLLYRGVKLMNSKK